MTNLTDLAVRCERLDAKLGKMLENRNRVSVDAQAIAIAMLVTLEMNLFGECAQALRNLARTQSAEAK